MEEYELWEHPVGDLYEEMENEGLIPVSGDSEYFWPAMVLRVNRLLYERLNNGNFNYASEDECDGFYHAIETDLNRFGRKYGLGRLGTAIISAQPDKVWETLNVFVEFVKKHRHEWKTVRWVPLY